MEEILATTLTKIRVFENVYSYTAGAHKSIKVHHTCFMNNPEFVGAIFDYMIKSGTVPDMYVMICGRVTPVQRDIIRRRCIIDTDNIN